MTVINASAAVKLLEQRPEKFQALSGIRTLDVCDAGAVSALPTELSKPHESSRIRVSPLCVSVILGPSIVKSQMNFVH